MTNEEARLLVVDDEEPLCRTICEALHVSGYTCDTALTAAAAEAKLCKQHYPLVVLDLRLPDTTDLELLARIKERDADTMVIVVTGVEELETAVEAMKRGAEDYITKPIQILRLQSAVQRALEKRRLFVENRQYQQQLEIVVAQQTGEIARQQDTIKRLLHDTIETLAAALEAKHRYTEGHSRRVTQYGLRLARALGMSDDELRQMELGGLLHDIGKVGVPDGILAKEGRLTEEEYAEIKKHPFLGATIVARISSIGEIVVQCVRNHHERWDGKGYPDGLSEDRIPLPGRILAVADAFDAMTSSRAYRPAMSVQQALQEVEKNSGAQFAPELATMWLDLFSYSRGAGGNILVVDDEAAVR